MPCFAYLSRTFLFTMLTPQQQNFYRQHGYLALPDFKTPAELASVRVRAAEIVEEFDANQNRSIFTTREQSRSVDDYFMASAANISCFFEEEAFDANGLLKQPKAQSINKIGHALHDLDPVFGRFSRGPQLAALAFDLGLQVPQVWQSMVIFKQPRIGGEVGWHQDASFFDTQPISVTSFWFALEDATLDNGCLWVQPGGHRSALRERFVATAGSRAEMQVLDTTPWPDQTQAIALPVPAGTLLVLHGLLPHYSAPNRSAVSRMAYTLHVTDGRCVYSAQNWLQREPDLPIRGLE